MQANRGPLQVGLWLDYTRIGSSSGFVWDEAADKVIFKVNWPAQTGKHGMYFDSGAGKFYITGDVIANGNVVANAGLNAGKVGVASGSAYANPSYTVTHNLGRYAIVSLHTTGGYCAQAVLTGQTTTSFTFTRYVEGQTDATEGMMIATPGTVYYSWI